MTAPHAKPRLFYDCPLKVAFMAKYFGMKFERSDGDLLLDWDDMEDDLATCIASGSWEDWYVIHPDSLPLLEPIEDDILLRTNGYCQQVGWQIGIPKAKAQLDAGATIIQRNGIPFMWPEREAP